MFLSEQQSHSYDLVRSIIRQAMPRVFVDDICPILWGKNSYVYRLNNSTILKFPRSIYSRQRLEKEVRVTNFLKPHMAKVPAMELEKDKVTFDEPLIFAQAELIEGAQLTRRRFRHLHPAEKNKIIYQVAQTLTEVHSYQSDQLKGLDCPDFEHAMQTTRFSPAHFRFFKGSFPRVYETTRSLCVKAILPRKDEEKCLIHMDAHLGNLIFSKDYERIIGIIDWEMAAYGAPSAEFCTAGCGAYGLAFLDLIRAYEHVCGRSVDKNLLGRYMAVNMGRRIARAAAKVSDRLQGKTR